jgi:hypothetical protein
MKNIILTAFFSFVGGIIFVALLSVSPEKAYLGSGGVRATYTIPIKPSSTVYVKGTEKMYEYLKKGYQVQEVVPNGSSTAEGAYVGFLMVKYKSYR